MNTNTNAPGEGTPGAQQDRRGSGSDESVARTAVSGLNKLTPKHLAHLKASVIDDAVIRERGYWSMSRGDMNAETKFRNLGIPKWFVSEPKQHHGLVIPMYGPRGDRVSVQYRPDDAPKDYRKKPGRDGQHKTVKYISPAGHSSRLDVHPRNTDKLLDPTVPLWITEGIKKGDALTSAGACTVSLTGVFNWRSRLATLGDWEDICLKGRKVVICFDADARTNANVLRAMIRLGRWLKSRDATPEFLIVPAKVGESAVKGVDDFFHAGGTMETLTQACTRTEPTLPGSSSIFTDAYMADTVADEVFAGRYVWTRGMGWLRWSGQVWRRCDESAAVEAVRLYVIDRCEDALRRSRTDDGVAREVGGWKSLLTATRLRAVTSLAKGSIQAEDDELDADPDLLNCADCIVDLRTGERRDHDPALMMTKIAGAEYRPSYRHMDWDKALEAVPEGVRPWLQLRLGQAATGHMPPDDLLVVSQGSGENGKSTINTVTATALGGYYVLLSDRVLMANPSDHPTELMDLMGARYAVMEETPEARRLDTQRLKRTVGTPQITARRMRQDSVTFTATHSMFISTNFRPEITETDHGSWRRLALVTYPYVFRKPGEDLTGEHHRTGDPGLRDRCRFDTDVHAAALAWMVEGAQRWYAADKVMPPLPEQVKADTMGWRKGSDKALAFISEQLVFDDRHVEVKDLKREMDAWLLSKGLQPWSETTIAARFGGHEEFRSRGVEAKKVRANNKISRPELRHDFDSHLPLGATYKAWVGVRFRTPADDVDEWVETPDQDHVPAVPAPLVDAEIASRIGGTRLAGTAGTPLVGGGFGPEPAAPGGRRVTGTPYVPPGKRSSLTTTQTEKTEENDS